MQVTFTANEMNVIETNLNKLAEISYELFGHNSPEEFKNQVTKILAKEIEFTYQVDGSVIINISEEVVIKNLEFVGKFYYLIFKIAKIVKPTVELLLSECTDDLIELEEIISR